MLQTPAVKEDTLALLDKIMTDKFFNKFFLVGGTSLALQLEHRQSVDLDLFSLENIDISCLNEYLKSHYGFIRNFAAPNTLKGTIEGVEMDFISYKYPLLKPIMKLDNFRLASIEDVTAMKLSAIVNNGTRIKDFVDIAYLSNKFCLNEMLNFYKKKYDEDPTVAVHSLTYYDDIDFSDKVKLVAGRKFSWELIKTRLCKMIRNPNAIFDPVKFSV